MRTWEVVFTVRIEAETDEMLGQVIRAIEDGINTAGYVASHQVVESPTIGSDWAATHRTTAARVVVRAAELGADVTNAWEVLVAGVGDYAEASHLLRQATPQADTLATVHNLHGYQEG